MLNAQARFDKSGNLVSRGIEWLPRVFPDGGFVQGYTWNVITGCLHECQWEMPDGQIAECYAKTIAEGLAAKSYPHGFAHHYVHPERLKEILRLKGHARVFIDSMSDALGAWVVRDEILTLCAAMNACPEITFLCLTKNAPRIASFADDFPANLQVGISSAPDWYKGKRLTPIQQDAYMRASLRHLASLRARRPDIVTWMSFEPLSRDYAAIVSEYPDALRWAVIGAASRGRTYYQPERAHVERTLHVLDAQRVPVFFKGNLKASADANEWAWREEYPDV